MFFLGSVLTVEAGAFIEVLHPWEILMLFDVLVQLLVEIILTSSTQKSWESWFSHAWKPNGHKDEFFHTTHLLLAEIFEKILVKLVFEFVELFAQRLQLRIITTILLPECFWLRFFHFELLVLLRTHGKIRSWVSCAGGHFLVGFFFRTFSFCLFETQILKVGSFLEWLCNIHMTSKFLCFLIFLI